MERGGEGVSVSYPKTNIHADLSPDGTNQGGEGEVVWGGGGWRGFCHNCKQGDVINRTCKYVSFSLQFWFVNSYFFSSFLQTNIEGNGLRRLINYSPLGRSQRALITITSL